METKESKLDKRFQVKGRVKVIEGSILNPEIAGLRFVLNFTNMLGKPESPLYPIFEKKWKKVREEARGWYTNKTGAYKLGAINTVAVQSDVWVINMLCQDDKLIPSEEGAAKCLKEVCALAKSEKASVHVSNLLVALMPKLADLLDKEVIENGVAVYFYNEK